MRLRALLAFFAATALLVSGCGGSPEPKPLPKPSGSATSSSPSPPVMPATAKEKSKRGAGLFVRHYVAVLNYAGSTGETSDLEALSAKSCVKCRALVEGIQRVYRNGGSITGGGWHISKVRHYGFDGDVYLLDVIIQSDPQTMRPSASASPQEFPGASNRLRAFVLSRSAASWQVAEIDPKA